MFTFKSLLDDQSDPTELYINENDVSHDDSFIPFELYKIFGRFPNDEDVGLSQCKICNRVVLNSVFQEHMEVCEAGLVEKIEFQKQEDMRNDPEEKDMGEEKFEDPNDTEYVPDGSESDDDYLISKRRRRKKGSSSSSKKPKIVLKAPKKSRRKRKKDDEKKKKKPKKKQAKRKGSKIKLADPKKSEKKKKIGKRKRSLKTEKSEPKKKIAKVTITQPTLIPKPNPFFNQNMIPRTNTPGVGVAPVKNDAVVFNQFWLMYYMRLCSMVQQGKLQVPQRGNVLQNLNSFHPSQQQNNRTQIRPIQPGVTRVQGNATYPQMTPMSTFSPYKYPVQQKKVNYPVTPIQQAGGKINFTQTNSVNLNMLKPTPIAPQVGRNLRISQVTPQSSFKPIQPRKPVYTQPKPFPLVIKNMQNNRIIGTVKGGVSKQDEIFKNMKVAGSSKKSAPRTPPNINVIPMRTTPFAPSVPVQKPVGMTVRSVTPYGTSLPSYNIKQLASYPSNMSASQKTPNFMEKVAIAKQLLQKVQHKNNSTNGDKKDEQNQGKK